ncbi:MAG TPA: S46 family peptidase [Rhodanobacteraceae bacterium]|nr:S46 family peptidase [Rhodanobacteraceae bacterium]
MRGLAPLLLLSLLCAPLVHADEGLWRPGQVPAMAEALKARGLALDPQALADIGGAPLGAVVQLAGCSGAVVSSAGLILAGRDCVLDALRAAGTANRDLITDGFLASTPAEALPLAGVHAYVTLRVSDVTKAIEAGLHPWLTGVERHAKVVKARARLLASCEEAGMRCSVRALHGGLGYRLVRQRQLDDIRLVYAPPSAIADFGGEHDAWSWPRQSAGFVLLRAFATAADGTIAAWRPEQVLKIAANGVAEGDFVMAVGYPRDTHREALAAEVQAEVNWRDPTLIEVDQARLGIIRAAVAGNPGAAGKYASVMARLEDEIGQARAEVLALRRAHAVDRRQAREAGLTDWLKQQKGRERARQRRAIGELRKALAAVQQTRERDLAIDLVTRPALLSAALDLQHLAAARGKDEARRDPGFHQRDWPRIQERLRTLDSRFDPEVEQRLLVHALQRYVALPADEHLDALDEWLGKASTEKQLAAKVAHLYAGSTLASVDARMALFTADAKTLAASNDRLIMLARALQPALAKLREDALAATGKVAKYRIRVMHALLDWERAGKVPVYADADGGLRLRFGTVQGVSPRDAEHYDAFATVRGIAQKQAGQAPWAAPEAEIDAINAGAFDGYASPPLGTLPVAFLADLDTVSGDLGAPVLDARGQLVGMVVRGTRTGASRQWLYDARTQRSVQLDARYLLWVLHHLAHGDRLLAELGFPAPREPASGS